MAKYGLFEVYGVELEYMIVDRGSLRVRPIADRLIEMATGEIQSEVDRGMLGWSNELVSHVIELKTNGPVSTLDGLAKAFHDDVLHINRLLEGENAILLPSGAHPFFDPAHETVIWPHEHNEVYELYDRIFGCTGHGWSNLQSTHLNLPFASDEEFGKLHGAIRVLLPLIPGLCASTPILDGKATGFRDTRLEFYRKNQQKIPVIAGKVIPEAVFDHASYEREIFTPIKDAIRPFDAHGILDKHFLNSRGAIARFDRGAIEIRLIDIQECPNADIAIVELIVEVLKWLVARFESNLDVLKSGVSTDQLSTILIDAIKDGAYTKISDDAYLELLGINGPASAREVWSHLYGQVSNHLSSSTKEHLSVLLSHGTLSERILQAVGTGDDRQRIESVYRSLGECLAENRMF